MSSLIRIGAAYLQAKFLRRFADRSALEAWQHQMVIRHLRKILPLSGYYRDLFSGLPLERWKEFPITDKAAMMRSFDRFNTVGVSKAEARLCADRAEASRDFSATLSGITVGLSSGTSGSHGIFLASAAEKSKWVGVVLAKVLDSPFKRQKIALFLRANSELYEALGQSRIQFQYFDLQKSIGSQLQTLGEFSPDLIVAPPSVLKIIAEFQQEGALALRPTKIISCAEVLEIDHQRFIERAFSLPVHQIYQATEGFLGASCKFGTIHLNEDYLVVEREQLDSRRFVPVITDFTRSTQPLIRYRLNDILVEAAAPCPCGSVMRGLERIEGRCDDIFYFPRKSSGRLEKVFPDFIRGAVIRAGGDRIANYKVIQRGVADLEVLIEPGGSSENVNELYRDLTIGMERLFSERDLNLPQLKFTGWKHEPGMTKLRRIEQRMEKAECREVSAPF